MRAFIRKKRCKTRSENNNAVERQRMLIINSNKHQCNYTYAYEYTSAQLTLSLHASSMERGAKKRMLTCNDYLDEHDIDNENICVSEKNDIVFRLPIFVESWQVFRPLAVRNHRKKLNIPIVV